MCGKSLSTHLGSLVDSGHISLVGGHIRLRSYKDLLAGRDFCLLFTARDPYHHFISKLNHEVNNKISANVDELSPRLIQIARPTAGSSSMTLSLSEIEDIIDLDSIFSIPAMSNYLKAFIELDHGRPNARTYPFFSESLSTCLQYFVWNEKNHGISLSRQDPARVRIDFHSDSPPTNHYSLQWCMPVLNSGANRKYKVSISVDEENMIREFLRESVKYYEEIKSEHQLSIDRAKARGFEDLPIKKCYFATMQ